MGPHTIDKGTNHSPPPASGDSDDRMDMARRNFENEPAEVRAAVVAVYGTVTVRVDLYFVEGAERSDSSSSALKAFRSNGRNVWRPSCASRADMATTLGLLSCRSAFATQISPALRIYVVEACLKTTLRLSTRAHRRERPILAIPACLCLPDASQYPKPTPPIACL